MHRQPSSGPELVSAALVAWSPRVVLGEEVAHSNRASQTWQARVGDQRALVKLTFDGPPYVEPGFRVAAHVQAGTGVRTGAPILTSSGQVTVPITVAGNLQTLAVMEHVAGEPVGRFDDVLASKAGLLLASVHGCLGPGAPTVPGAVLDFFERRRSAPEVAATAKTLNALLRAGEFTAGVVYGDPSPELLLGDDDNFSLIDWGTPSYGPFIYDVAAWFGHIERHGDTSAATWFLQSYRSASPLHAAEYDTLELCAVLWRSLFTAAS